jgi:hypothetical protein
MGVMGGRIGSESATKVLAFSFLLNDGDIDKWIEDLRVSDYDANYDWTGLKI